MTQWPAALRYNKEGRIILSGHHWNNSTRHIHMQESTLPRDVRNREPMFHKITSIMNCKQHGGNISRNEKLALDTCQYHRLRWVAPDARRWAEKADPASQTNIIEAPRRGRRGNYEGKGHTAIEFKKKKGQPSVKPRASQNITGETGRYMKL
jgi:hypothetical protein